MTIERMKVIRDHFKSLRMCMTEFMLPSITMECHECDLQDIESILDDYITLLEQESSISKIISDIKECYCSYCAKQKPSVDIEEVIETIKVYNMFDNAMNFERSKDVREAVSDALVELMDRIRELK